MTCNIIKDLLPLYAAEDCSDDSREAVDDHIKTCDSCRSSLLAMQEPVAPPQAPEVVQQEKKVEAMNFRKGFKRIRRRWLISILCVLLAIPFGVLGVNEVRGEGYAYSNLYAVYQTDAFMRKIVAKDYEGAVEIMNVRYLYDVCLMIEKIRDDVYDKHRQVEIGGEVYISRLPKNSNRLVRSLENGDPAEFWAQMIVDNEMEEDVHNPIPAEFMETAAQIVSEKTGKEVIILSADQDTANVENAYVEGTGPDGKSYYFPATINHEEDFRYSPPMIDQKVDFRAWAEADYLPERMFIEKLDTMFYTLKGFDYHSQTYEKLGFDEYSRLFKEQYIETLKKLDAQGIYVTSYSLNPGHKYLEEYAGDNGSFSPMYLWEIEVYIQSSSPNTTGNDPYLSLAFHNSKVWPNGYGGAGSFDGEVEEDQMIELLDALFGEVNVL